MNKKLHAGLESSTVNSKSDRVIGLDITRGLAVLAMILVVSPGSWNHKFSLLDHATWHGYTPADIVFPLFLFSVGAAMALHGFSPRNKLAALTRVAKRVSLLILLGLFLNLLPSFDFSTLRIPGILQRIALCYGLAAITIIIFSSPKNRHNKVPDKTIVVAILFLLIVWQLVLSLTSASGFPAGDLSQGGTLASWMDRKIFTASHLWPYGTDADGAIVYDPEGLLATFPATINVFIGILTLSWTGRNPENKQLYVALIIGSCLVLIGHIAGQWFEINKRIWTSSFALVSGGWTVIIYSVIVILSKKNMFKTLLIPSLWLGGNAILAFSLSQILGAYAYINIAGHTPQGFFFHVFQEIVGDPYLASFLCSVLVVGTITVLIYPLHRKGIHLRM